LLKDDYYTDEAYKNRKQVYPTVERGVCTLLPQDVKTTFKSSSWSVYTNEQGFKRSTANYFFDIGMQVQHVSMKFET
jgi:hypothetical protein